MKKTMTALATMALTLLLTLPTIAAEKAGIIMLDTQMVGSQQLWINGMALREKFVFDVYVAALYLPERSSDAKAILAADTPRMMVMHFVRDVDAKAINEAWYEGLEANVENVTPELTSKFDQLAAMTTDINEGQVMGFTYNPGSGTEIMIAGQPKGGIPGKDFADAILATWIGPKPGPGKRFKAAILGE